MNETLPAGWVEDKLSSFTSLEYGKSPNSVKDEQGRYPIIGTSGTVGKATQFIWGEPSVVIGRKGTINNPIYVDEPFWAIDTTFYCKLTENTHPKWFFYKICDEALEKHNEASGVPSLSRETLKSIHLKVPPLSEQKKIASILTSVDEVIENTQKQIEKLQDLKKATMNELLTKGIGHTEFKESELGRIPKSWSCPSIQELLNSNYLITVKDGNHGAQYPRTSEFQKSGIPFLAASNISENGDFDVAKLPCLSLERAATLRIPNARGGDVILTHNATVGRVTIIPETIDEIIASTSTTYYRANSSCLHNHYLRDFFEGLPFQNQLGRIMGQTTRNQVPITAQKELYVVLPNDILEQQKISEIISAIRGNLAIAKKQLAARMSLKKSLMQDLLTGKVRVQVN